jgi:hypothetical protein
MLGGNPSETLGLCEGDCDSDSDCEGDLVCFQRTSAERVPGCSGTGYIQYDYCIQAPPTAAPSAATLSPSFAPSQYVPLPLVRVGDGDYSNQKLARCEGDCDGDSDCEDGLVCFQQDALEAPPIPGCTGTDSSDWDYCFKPPAGEPALVTLGADPSETLGLCEGDCDSDSDCEGDLVCFQRTSAERVPGCSGTGYIQHDYCIQAPPTAAPSAATLSPSFAPSQYVPLPLVRVGDGDYSNQKLARCEGDCDGDSDCEDGLVCFQQDALEAPPIPGCTGTDIDDWDYCFKPPADEPVLVMLGGNPSETLGLCEGDCDSDSDCEGDLVCFQRTSAERVPGCSGTGYIQYDYCIQAPPTAAPSAATLSPSFAPSQYVPLPLVRVGDGDYSNQKLARCEGDCDGDSDCEDGLVCFQQDALEAPPIPGCTGTDSSDWDYCFKPPAGEPALVTLGADPSETLGLCEGDCDSDSDCEGDLVCFQRTSAERVPGCSGTGNIQHDYCILNFTRE